MELELLRKEVAKKKLEKREREERSRLERELFELNNPEIIKKRKLKEQKSLKIRKVVKKLLSNARKGAVTAGTGIRQAQSPQATQKRLEIVHGYRSARASRPSKKSKRHRVRMVREESYGGGITGYSQGDFSLI